MNVRSLPVTYKVFKSKELEGPELQREKKKKKTLLRGNHPPVPVLSVRSPCSIYKVASSKLMSFLQDCFVGDS